MAVRTYGPDMHLEYVCIMILEIWSWVKVMTPSGYWKQLCEKLSRSNIARSSYGPDTDFGYVYSSPGREGFDSSVIMPFFLVCCGCDDSYIVTVHIKCQASIFLVSGAFMADVASQAGDADSSQAPGLTSGLQGSVHGHLGALLLVPQWLHQFFCILLDVGEMTLGQSHDTPLGHRQQLCEVFYPDPTWQWEVIARTRILGNSALWPWLEIWPWIKVMMTLDQGHDTPLRHGQQFCEILSRSNMAVRSYDLDTDFGYVCTVTLTLELWPWEKVLTHPLVIDNNCVNYHIGQGG